MLSTSPIVSPAAPSGLPETAWHALKPHPRLFADAARLAVIKAQTDDVSHTLLDLLRSEAEKHLMAPPLIYPATGFIMDAVRTVQGRIITLSMQFRLTGNARYFEKARRELLQLADLPEWRPGHFLDVGEAALAAGIGLDWLYDDLSPSDRDRVAHAIVHNALLPSLKVEEGMGGWVDGDFNWNQVCHSGLVVGALAVAEREPELARRVVARAVRNVPHAGASYAPHGAYPEGPSYWSYGTTFHVLLVEALRSVFGTSCDLEKGPGFLQTADYLAQMVGPTGQDFNYSDYHERAPSEPVLLWFARERKSREPAREELDNLARAHAALRAADGSVDSPALAPGTALSRHLAFGLLWWNPDLPPLPATPTLPLHWTTGGAAPLAVLRSSWNDPNATYVAIKGGSPFGSHGHMDAGGFILEADGVRWAVDLGTENYNRMRTVISNLWDYSQNSARWTTFRVGPEGHNILRFDGARQNVAGKAEIRALPPENGNLSDIVDLTTLYEGQVAHVTRRVVLRPDRTVFLEDEWTTGERAVDASWQWLTRAEEIETAARDGVVVLRQDGKLLELQMEVSPPGDFTVKIEDVSPPANPQDSPNPGLRRIVVRLQTEAHRAATLRVNVVPGSVRQTGS